MPKEAPNGTNKGPEETQKIFFFNNLAVEKVLWNMIEQQKPNVKLLEKIKYYFITENQTNKANVTHRMKPLRSVNNSNHQTNPDSLPSKHSTPSVCHTIPDSSEDSFKTMKN